MDEDNLNIEIKKETLYDDCDPCTASFSTVAERQKVPSPEIKIEQTSDCDGRTLESFDDCESKSNQSVELAGQNNDLPKELAAEYQVSVIGGKVHVVRTDSILQRSPSSGMREGVPNNPDGLSMSQPTNAFIDDESLLQLPVRMLNRKLSQFPQEKVAFFKHKRRTLKNRGYATNSRQKRLRKKVALEITQQDLRNELYRFRRENIQLTMERDVYKFSYENLKKQLDNPSPLAENHKTSSEDEPLVKKVCLNRQKIAQKLEEFNNSTVETFGHASMEKEKVDRSRSGVEQPKRERN